MATFLSPTTIVASISKYFRSEPSPQPPDSSTPPPSGRLANWAGAAATGAADELYKYMETHQQEISDLFKNVASKALLEKAPAPLYEFRQLTQSLQATAQVEEVEKIKSVLSNMTPEKIPLLGAKLNEEGLRQFHELKLAFEVITPTDPDVGLTIPDVVCQQMIQTEQIVSTIISEKEAVLPAAISSLRSALIEGDNNLIKQAVNGLLQTLLGPTAVIGTDEDAVDVLFRRLREAACGKPHEFLQQCHDALRSLKLALEQNQPRATLLPLWEEAAKTLRQLKDTKATVFPRQQLISDLQWQQLELVHGALQARITDTTHLLPHGQQLAEFSPAFKIIEDAFNGQKGWVEALGDSFNEKITAVIHQVEALPGRIIANLMPEAAAAPAPSPPAVQQPVPPPVVPAPAPPVAQQAMPPPAASPAVPAPTPVPGQSTAPSFIQRLIDYATPVLAYITSHISDTMAQYAARSLTTLLIFTFDKIKANLQASGEHPHVHNIIDPLLARLRAAQQRGTWEDNLVTLLGECIQELRTQLVYVQGMRLPFSQTRAHISAIPDFLRNITDHEAALNIHRSGQTQITEAMIKQEALKLEKRASALVPIQLICTYICGFTEEETDYPTLLELSPDASIEECEKTFRSRLFDKIDRSDLFFLRKWTAKMLYDCMTPISTFFTKGFIENGLHYYENWKANTDPTSPREMKVVRLIRNWLAIVSNAYNQATDTSQPAKDLPLMLEEALQAPARNYGLTQPEVYSAFAQSALEQLGPRFQWRKQADVLFSAEIPQDSFFHFLNPALKGFNLVCNYAVNAALFIPEWILNQLIQLVGKFFLRNSSLLQQKIDKTLNSFSSNTPESYALYKVIYRQLQKISEAMRANLAQDPLQAPLATRGSEASKEEISTLVQYLLEVLNKSKYTTQDRLRNYLHGRLTLVERVGRELDEAFFPQALETAVNSITIALQTSLSDEGLQEMLYDTLTLANDSFEMQERVSEEQFTILKRAIAELTDEILESAIFYALGDRFDFNGDKQKAGVRQFFADIQQDMRTYIAETKRAFSLTPQALVSNPRYLEHLKTTIDRSMQFQRRRMEALGRADGNRYFHTDVKQKLNEVSSELGSHCDVLGQSFNESVRLAQENQRLQKVSSSMDQFQRIFQSLERLLCHNGAQEGEVREAHIQKDVLAQSLTEYRSIPHTAEGQFLNTLNFHHAQTLSSLEQIESAHKELHELERINPLFQQLKAERARTLSSPSPSAELKRLEKELVRVLNSLSPALNGREITAKLLPVMQSASSLQLHQTEQEFTIHLLRTFARTHQKLHAGQEQIRRSKIALEQASRYEQAQARQQTQNHCIRLEQLIGQICNQLNTFEAWGNGLHEIPITYFVPFDMQGITDMTKNLAFGIAKSEVDQLLKALYQKHNYFSGLQHMVFFPWLQQHGTHFLKA